MTLRSLPLALFVFGCVSVIQADTTGSILGTVRDSSNSAIVGAHVVATNVATNFSKESVSNAEGEYRILALPPGSYHVQATASGFDQFLTTGIDLEVND